MKRFFLVFALWAGGVCAHDYTTGTITVDHPFIFASPGPTAAGYRTLTPIGDNDRLIAVTSPRATATLHKTITDGAVVKMRAAGVLDITKDAPLTFAPGGLHIMFTGLSGQLHDGDTVPATLVFETSGPLDVVFNVDPRKAIDHANH
ncbi:MAG: copper chaperone PCu(A)C [Pseudomonadota bacterium]